MAAADFKGRIGRISTTRRSLANLPSGGSSNLDPADISSPKARQRDHHHKRHSSRVDVISEKEELAAEDNSLSQQEANESQGGESPQIASKASLQEENRKLAAQQAKTAKGHTQQSSAAS